MDKTPPASAVDVGLIPGLGRFRVLRGDSARAPQLESTLWSLCSAARDASAMGNLRTAARVPRSVELESLHAAAEAN